MAGKSRKYTIKGWERLSRSRNVRKPKPKNQKAFSDSQRFERMTMDELVAHCNNVIDTEFTLDGVDPELVRLVYNKFVLANA